MTTANNIVTHLESRQELEMKKEGSGRYRLNSPLRPGSNSRGFVLTIEADGEHGAYFDHVTGDTGSLYDLSDRLGVQRKAHHAPTVTKRSYDGLADYAKAHHAPPEAFIAAGWGESTAYQNRPALPFKTQTGTRYRFIDGEKPPYINERGYKRCWYGLGRAVTMTRDTGQPLIICNGEASTVTAQHYGLAAVCVTSGEKAALPDDLLAELRGAYTGPVLVAYDCDKKGRTAAPKLATQLTQAGYQAKAIDLAGADGFDLADFCGLYRNEAVAKLQTLPTISDDTPAPTDSTAGRRPTHDELADRWRLAAPLTAYGLADWRRYRAGLWPVLNESIIKSEVKQVLIAAKSEGVKPTAATLASVMEFCRLDVFNDDSLWDANPNYLVCANGALHIPSMELHPHDPELYATTGVDYPFDPTATAPNWKRFLKSLSADTRQFLQEFAGYALTIDTAHEIAVWLYGPPGGGKSTFLTGLQTMLGNRAGLLGLGEVERSQFALSNLPGKTLIVAAEQPHTFIKSTHILNAIISGEPLTIERKFRDAYEITPRAKLCWAMNELPRISDPNSGLFRRVKVVKFPAIDQARQDVTLKNKIRAEGPGILNWALNGLERLLCRGRFDIPASITAATDDFKANNDVPAAFVSECCITVNDSAGEPYKTQSSILYAKYKDWCIENGHRPQSSTRMAAEWERLGFERTRIAGKTFWRGVGVAGL